MILNIRKPPRAYAVPWDGTLEGLRQLDYKIYLTIINIIIY